MADNLSQALTDAQTCPTVGYQSASICVPVTVVPFAKTGTTATKCCGSPVVVPGKNTCGGVKNGTCSFTISQDICVAIPVEFGAVATVGDTFVNCNGASAEDICTDCGVVPQPIGPAVPTQLDIPVNKGSNMSYL
ncbi:MAG: hypothetical protein RR131_07845 [Anaerovorax sp.]